MRTQTVRVCAGLRAGKAACGSRQISTFVTFAKRGYARREAGADAHRGLSRARPRPSPHGTPSSIGASRLHFLGHRPGAVASRSTAVRRSVIQRGEWWGPQAAASSVGTKRLDLSGPRTCGTASRARAISPAALQRGDRSSAQPYVSSIGTTRRDFIGPRTEMTTFGSSAVSPAAFQRRARKCAQATVSIIGTTSLDFSSRLPRATASKSVGAPR